jgi:NAD(P)-dependent dehydrogenase (short-subunit alcohol dehydrogenase family)
LLHRDDSLETVAAPLRRAGAKVQTVQADLRTFGGVDLPGMVTRRRGKILITSSIASTMPGSFQAVYNASKSFLQSFAEALQNELKDTGVTVTSLMPGPTDTSSVEPTCSTRRSGRPRRTTRRWSPGRGSRR